MRVWELSNKHKGKKVWVGPPTQNDCYLNYNENCPRTLEHAIYSMKPLLKLFNFIVIPKWPNPLPHHSIPKIIVG